MDEPGIRDLIKVWYSRSRRERDAFSKFVFLWFCFNAWLAFESSKDGDSEMIRWLKGAPASRSRLRSAYDLLHDNNYFQGRIRALASLCPIATSRPGKPDIVISSVDDFPNIVEAIYRVRCSLFHGAKRANDLRDIKLVKVCSEILEKWVGNLVTDLKRP